MMVLNSRVLVRFDGQTFLKPFDRACVPNELGRHLYNAAPDRMKWSNIDCWERRYGGQDLAGKSLCLVRYQGIGDLLMMTALVRYLRHTYPTALIHFYTLASMYSSNVLYGNPDLDGSCAFPLPVALDAIKQYDYHIFIDGMIEHNAERDQSNAYDDLFAFCGLRDVADEWKRPHLRPLPGDWKWVEDSGMDLSRPYVAFQTQTSTPIRDYPAEMGAQCVDEMLKRMPGHRVAIMGQVESPAFSRFKGNERVLWCVGAPNWRYMIPVVYGADCLVTGDTGMGHVAAAFPHVPVVGLWGAFSHASRAKYYRNHTPIEHAGVCPHQPCYTHGQGIPVAKCRASRAWKEGQTHCSAMLDIAPAEIADAVARRVIAGKPGHVGMMTVEAFKKAFGWAEASVADKKYGSDLDRNVIQSLAVWRKPESVCEVGINEGRQAELILKALPGVKEYVGVDVTPDAKMALAGQQAEVPKIPGHMVADDARLRLIIRPRGLFDCKPDELPAADFWFIDGDHSDAGVEHDTLKAFLRAPKGAVIVWHDFWNEQDRNIGVARVLERLAPTLPLKIRHVLGSMVAFAVKE